MAELNTYGDLKKVIKSISTKQKGEKIGQVALDTVIGLIPGAGNAKTTFDFIKAAFSKPDTKKTSKLKLMAVSCFRAQSYFFWTVCPYVSYLSLFYLPCLGYSNFYNSG